jgi:hypothetical protein
MADESTTADKATETTPAKTDTGTGTESTSSGTDTASTTASGGQVAATPTMEGTAEVGAYTFTPAGPTGGPVPGDPSSEQVATALQSWAPDKRVGPQTIAEDSDAPWHTPPGMSTVAPGAEVDPGFPMSGAMPPAPVVAEMGAGPYGSETPAPAAANVVTQTTPGTEGVTPEELPPGVPTASNKSASGGPVTIPADKSGTPSVGQTSTTSGPSGSPTLPTEGPASSTSPGSAGGTETADSGSGGSATDPAESSGTSEPSGSAGSPSSTSDKPSTSG